MMKNIVSYLNESNTDLYHPMSNNDIKRYIKELDPSEWYKIDTSYVIDMSSLFKNYNGKFGDISNWDVSKVKNSNKCFFMCPLEKNPPVWYKK